MKRIAILGSTGSIGKSTLNVVSACTNEFEVIGLTANTDIQSLAEQIRCYKPRIAAIGKPELVNELKQLVGATNTRIVSGQEGLVQVATHPDVDAVMAAIVGAAGLLPTLEAIKSGKEIHLANKEVLVMAGEIVNKLLKEFQVDLLPVDSEHNAIFQCLHMESRSAVEKIILTASGGPFRYMPQDELKDVTVEMALKHPNWDMGPKITVDSATMMNKGLEIIEAHWLFQLEPAQIEVLIHPESIIHSMVQFVDGSVLAQLGASDMRIPIQYALTYPRRISSSVPRLDFEKLGKLHFLKPDLEKFPALKIAQEVLKQGHTFAVVMNAANEEAVGLFLKKKIQFLDIMQSVEYVLGRHTPIPNATLETIIQIDQWARQEVRQWQQTLLSIK